MVGNKFKACVGNRHNPFLRIIAISLYQLEIREAFFSQSRVRDLMVIRRRITMIMKNVEYTVIR